MGFVVRTVALEQVFRRLRRSCPVIIIPPVIHNHSTLCHRLCDLSKGQHYQIKQFMACGGKTTSVFPSSYHLSLVRLAFRHQSLENFILFVKKKYTFFSATVDLYGKFFCWCCNTTISPNIFNFVFLDTFFAYRTVILEIKE